MEKPILTKRILLIDDDAVTNMINSRIINMHFNFTVDAYTSAQEALEYCWQCTETNLEQFPDNIFLDINMPVMDGWEFLHEFEKLPSVVKKKCKLYMLTSSIDADDIEKSKTFKSVAEFVSKPLTQSKLKMLEIEEEAQ